jgi:hypothetical protein
MTQHYRQCRQARVQLRRWFANLLQLLDALHIERIQLGNAQFNKLRAASARTSPPSGS